MAISIGTRRELFLDKHLLDTMQGTELKLHEPRGMETSIKIDRPWEGGANFGGTVIKVDDRYHMYYRAMDPAKPEDAQICLAVSEDGIHWEKPALQPEGTNFVGGNNHFLDKGPAAADGTRVKGFLSEGISGGVHNAFGEPKGAKRGVFFASKEGKFFEKMDPQPKLESDLMNSFDGGCSLFWSEAEQQYVLYMRYSLLNVRDDEQNATGWQRSMARTTSKDLYHWTPCEEMRYSDTPEQFYVNGTQPYFRAPHIYVGLAARYMERKRVLTQEQEAACGVCSVTAESPNSGEVKTWHYADDCSDAVLLSTRAGSNVYDRTFMEAFVYPGLGHNNWVSRTNYPLDGGFHQLDDTSMSFYIMRNYMQSSWHIQRMSLRLDGIASLHAPWKGGEATTKPLIYDGSELELNFRTSAAGWIRVELLDEDGNLLPGFDRACCDPIVGDEISKTVTWRSGYSMAKYAGMPVRLRFVMKDADIYSYKFCF